MSKIKANYYYVPICPESFATLDRLTIFFSNVAEQVEFESINIAKQDYNQLSVSGEESEFLKSLSLNELSLSYGKLFINNTMIKGFPPSSSQIEKILRELSVDANYKLIETHYNLSSNEKLVNFGDMKTVQTNAKNCYDHCKICTKYSRYIDDDNYLNVDWEKYESKKVKQLLDSISEDELIGYVEYSNDNPVGMIEGYSSKIASKYGFPVTGNINSCMITCLHIRQEAEGNGIAKKLINSFLNAAKEKGFVTVEVVAYPGITKWQPIDLYKKMNFMETKKVGRLSIMVYKL